MPVGEAELQDAWTQVLDRFPFPEYIKIPRGHLEVARTVASLLPPGSRVLDFGAGPADKTGVVAALGFKCTAMDDLQDNWHRKPESRQKILDYAKDIGIDYIPMNGEDIPPTTGEFDMVMSHDVLEHLHDPPQQLVYGADEARSHRRVPLRDRPESRQHSEADCGAFRRDQPSQIRALLLGPNTVSRASA